jgi:hypothetical protein
MNYYRLDSNGNVTEVLPEYPRDVNREGIISRHDIADLDRAKAIAASATKLTGELYVGVDSGKNVSPRFDVIRAPQLGDDVSYGFNGDYYPDGKVIHVTEGSHKVVKTDKGGTYYRYKDSGRWTREGGTWSLVRGTRNERNPHF